MGDILEFKRPVRKRRQAKSDKSEYHLRRFLVSTLAKALHFLKSTSLDLAGLSASMFLLVSFGILSLIIRIAIFGLICGFIYEWVTGFKHSFELTIAFAIVFIIALLHCAVRVGYIKIRDYNHNRFSAPDRQNVL